MAKIADVIKYEGDNSTFVWKSPLTDFNTGTQLIVHENQEALFFMNGQALDLFGPGRHTLETENIPLIRHFMNLPTDGKTPFHCEVYFINKADQMDIKWGTSSKIQYMEPTFNFPISIGASGSMIITVEDSRKLLIKLVGTTPTFTRETLISSFREFLLLRLKPYIAREMRESAINIFQIDERLEEFSEKLEEKLKGDFGEYGLALKKFFITTIVKPDGERQFEEFKSLYFRQFADVKDAQIRQQVEIIDQQTQAQRLVIESQALATKRMQEGYTYQQERGFDVAQQAAKNEAIGEFANVGIGMGMITGVGAPMSSMVGGAMNEAFSGMAGGFAPQAPDPNATKRFCTECGNELSEGAAFCENCGTKVETALKETCPNCGFEFKSQGKFCPKCGTKRGERNAD